MPSSHWRDGRFACCSLLEFLDLAREGVSGRMTLRTGKLRLIIPATATLVNELVRLLVRQRGVKWESRAHFWPVPRKPYVGSG